MKLSEAITKYGDIDVMDDSFELIITTDKSRINDTLPYQGVGGEGERSPLKKKIDLSRLIESGLDCEFSSNKEFHEGLIGKLDFIGNEHFYLKNDSAWWCCRPRMNHLHAFPNGFEECPLPAGFNLQIHFRNGNTCNFSTADKIGNMEFVRFIRILGISDGWEL